MRGKSASHKLNYGLYLPNFGKVASPQTYGLLASDAEGAGWDGFFLWDHVIERDRPFPVTDSFIALAAMAVNTHRIRIGTAVTPLPKLKPWIAARQTVSLDHLSKGRFILGVGLGEEGTTGYKRFGEVAEKKLLAERLDESLEILIGLWTGKSFSFAGRHYSIAKTRFLPTPIQKPRIPIWVGGFWPNKGPFRRAAKYEGVLPLKLGQPIRPKPKDLRDILSYIDSHRVSKDAIDAAIIGWGTGRNREGNRKKIKPYADVGLTWWLESLYTFRDSLKDLRKRIRKGPPRIE